MRRLARRAVLGALLLQVMVGVPFVAYFVGVTRAIPDVKIKEATYSEEAPRGVPPYTVSDGLSCYPCGDVSRNAIWDNGACVSSDGTSSSGPCVFVPGGP